MFPFELKPLTKCVCPTGKNGQKLLAWFWLTDAYYYIALGEVELFRSSPEWLKKYPQEPLYVDYHYIRFLEDFFAILPDISVSIPKNIYHHINTFSKHEKLAEALTIWYQNAPDTKEVDDFYFDLASFLLQWGVLPTMHLSGHNYVAFLHVDDTMIIRYDFTESEPDGTPFWSAGKGEYHIPYLNFIAEIENMLEHFFTAMEQQVHTALTAMKQDTQHILYDSAYTTHGSKEGSNPLEGNCLKTEHWQRKAFFEGQLHALKDGSMEHAHTINWPIVEGNIVKLSKLSL